ALGGYLIAFETRLVITRPILSLSPKTTGVLANPDFQGMRSRYKLHFRYYFPDQAVKIEIAFRYLNCPASILVASSRSVIRKASLSIGKFHPCKPNDSSYFHTQVFFE
ncbi:MAG: hypothetical protein ABIR19_09370, partial [Ginsengibacter sp.]